MSLLSGFNVTLSEVGLLGEAAMAAFGGRPVPVGWNIITPQQLGVPPQYWDGNYFTNNGASAIVLQQGSTWIVSFRGTDGSNDTLQYPELAFGTYINHFQPLLNSVASHAPDGTNFYFTGASLGGGATNLMADIAGSQYGGEFASAKFVAFASPNISTASGILNVGFENDPIYRVLGGYNDFSSSLDNLVLATAQYMQGNYDGLLPPDIYAHTATPGFDAFARLQTSAFLDQMNPDSVVIFDAFNGTVQDITPGRENVGAFYLGEDVADVIVGRNGDDHIEGFGGDDTLLGGAGNDVLAGGSGNDTLNGGPGLDTAFYSSTESNYSITRNGSGAYIVTDLRPGSPDGTDTLIDVEQAHFFDMTFSIPHPTFPIESNLDVTEVLYIGYFGRAGDPGGASFWLGALKGGYSVPDAAASFSVQIESQNQYPFLAHPSTASQSEVASFIGSVYQDLFNRAPDQGGLDYWQSYLSAHLGDPHSVGTFILAVVNGAQNSAAGLDQTTITNKAEAAEFLTELFTGAGINFDLTPSVANAFAHTNIAGVTSDPASLSAAEAAVSSFINSVKSASLIGIGNAETFHSDIV